MENIKTTDGTEREGYYKLRLCTKDKVPLTSITGNDYYKLTIGSVKGFGANSFENAEKNGFTNDMEAYILLEYKRLRMIIRRIIYGMVIRWDLKIPIGLYTVMKP